MADDKKPARSPRKGAGAITLPSVRTYRLWTPGQIRSAEIAADGGYLRQAVDLCEYILADDKVKGSLGPRINAMLSAPVTFDRAGDKRRSSRAVKALESQEDWWSILPEAEARQVLAWAIMLGLGPSFLDWQQLPGHGGRDIPVLTFFHPQPIQYDWQARQWKRQLDRGGFEAIEFGDATWVGHMPDGAYRPWNNGLWRGLARWVLVKAYAISDYGRAGETAARTAIEIDKDIKSTYEQRKALAHDIDRMARDGSIVLPPGYHYRSVETQASTSDLYNRQIALADNAIAIAIRGGNLSTDVKGGSRAAAEVQERTGDNANLKADASAWENTTHDQILVHWATSNYGDPLLAPWPELQVKPPEDKKQKADVFLQVMTATEKATSQGFDVEREALANEFGLDGFLKPGKVIVPAPTDPNAPAGSKEPGAKEDPKAPAPKAKNSARLLSRPSGFIEGQLFIDALAETTAKQAEAALKPTLDAVLEELEAATDYDDLRARLRTRYEQLDAEELSELVHRALVIAELAGSASATQDQ
jgi:phage gp29-like protein